MGGGIPIRRSSVEIISSSKLLLILMLHAVHYGCKFVGNFLEEGMQDIFVDLISQSVQTVHYPGT